MKSLFSRFAKEELATSEFEWGRIIGRIESGSRDLCSGRVVNIWRRDGGHSNFSNSSVPSVPLKVRGLRGAEPVSPSMTIWTYSLSTGRTRDGRRFGVVTVLEENTGKCLTARIERDLGSECLIVALAKLFEEHGAPAHIRPQRGCLESTNAVRNWLRQRRGKTSLIEAEYRSEYAYRNSLSGQLRDWLKRTIFNSPIEAQASIETWFARVNGQRSFSA